MNNIFLHQDQICDWKQKIEQSIYGMTYHCIFPISVVWLWIEKISLKYLTWKTFKPKTCSLAKTRFHLHISERQHCSAVDLQIANGKPWKFFSLLPYPPLGIKVTFLCRDITHNIPKHFQSDHSRIQKKKLEASTCRFLPLTHSKQEAEVECLPNIREVSTSRCTFQIL